jgi:hypothetical protein
MRQLLPHQTRASGQTELALVLVDGTPWRLTMSKGCERFIGYYPRLAGFEGDGAVLSYRRVGHADS